MLHRRHFLWSIILMIGALSLISCGGKSSDETPAPAPAVTGTFTKFAILDGTQAGTTTTANGTGSLTVDTGTGAVSGSLTVQSAPTTTPVAAHVHEGAPGVSGGIQVTLTNSGGGVWSVPAGTVLTAAQIASFTAGNLYFAVHTGAAGEPVTGLIRGQIDKTSATLYARLDGAQETPSPVTTSAAGTGLLTLNADTRVVSGALTITVPPALAIFAAHVHVGDRGVGGPVLITLDPPASGGNVWTVPPTASLTPAQIDGVIAGFIAGNLYFNAHTGAGTPTPPGGFPTGEIRGQIDLIAP